MRVCACESECMCTCMLCACLCVHNVMYVLYIVVHSTCILMCTLHTHIVYIQLLLAVYYIDQSVTNYHNMYMQLAVTLYAVLHTL